MATIRNSVNSFRAIRLYPLNINETPDCAYATAKITSRSEAQIADDGAGHLNNNHQPESNPLNINEIPDCAYATAEITSRSEAQIADDGAGHLNNNHQPESNNEAMPVQPGREHAIAMQPDAEIVQLYILDKKVKMLQQLIKKNLKKMLLQSAPVPVY